MLPAFSILLEIVHWSALVPAGLLIVARRDAATVYWITALAFAVAWFHDAAALVLGGTWDLVPYFWLAQFALLCWAFGGPLLAGAYAALSATAWTAGAPFVAILGAIFVIAASKRHELFWAIWVYAGAGTLCYIGMEVRAADVFMPWWWGYQGARLVAFGLFAREALWKT